MLDDAVATGNTPIGEWALLKNGWNFHACYFSRSTFANTLKHLHDIRMVWSFKNSEQSEVVYCGPGQLEHRIL